MRVHGNLESAKDNLRHVLTCEGQSWMQGTILANQVVFKMARGVNPRGDRTVSIITECDVVQNGDEAGIGRCHSWTVLGLISIRSSALQRTLSKSSIMDGCCSKSVSF